MGSVSTTSDGEVPSPGAAQGSDSTQQRETSGPGRDLTERLDLSARQEFATIQDERAALVGMLAHLIANVERSGNRLTFALAVLSFCLFGAGAFIWLNMMQASGLRYGAPRQVLASVVPDRFPDAAPGKAEAAVRPRGSELAPALPDPEPRVATNAPADPRAEPGEAIAAAAMDEPPPAPPPVASPAAELARAPDLRPEPPAIAARAGDRVRGASAAPPRARPTPASRRLHAARAAPARREVRNTGSIRRAAPLREARRSEAAYRRVPIGGPRSARRRPGRPIVTTASHGGGVVELRPRVIALKTAPRRAPRRLVVAHHPW